jgi:MarR family transcriptional regulator, organic hydroperoxide resistance regulator
LRQWIVSIYNEFVVPLKKAPGKAGDARAGRDREVMDLGHEMSRRDHQVSDLGREIWSLLYRLFQAGRPALMAICQEYELTPSQAFLLRYLEPHKPIAMNVLADTLGCDASNITGLVDKLEARGLIQRQPDRADRRVKMIVVTEAGARFRKKLLSRLLEPPPSLAGLPEAEKRTLRNILKRAVEAAET